MSVRIANVLLVASLVSFLAESRSAENGVAAAIERGDYVTAAELLRTELGNAPANEAARFTLARVLAWSGDYAAAIAEYDTLIASSPANVDYLFGRAQVLSWSGHDEAALADLARARPLAPEYEDVWRLEFTILARSEDPRRFQGFRERAARRFPESEWWTRRDEVPSPSAATEVAFGASRDMLSTSVPDWTGIHFQIRHQRGPQSTVYGAVNQEQRFGRRDFSITGGGGWQMSGPWSAGFDLGVGPQADFVPRVAAAAWAGRALPHGWETRFSLQRREYEDAAVDGGAVMLGRYVGHFRAAYTLGMSRLQGDSTSASHSATVSYYASDRTQFDFTVAAGEEAEAIGVGQVLRTDVRSVTVGLRHRFSDRWRLSCWLGSHRQGELYTRRYVGFSLAAGL